MTQVLSYIFSFDRGENMKEHIKRIMYIALFIVSFGVVGKFLRYILVDDTNSYTRVMMHEFYDLENIDIIFVGSSHVYRAIVPTITDEKFACHTFNAGSSNQRMDSSEALIKEAIKNNDVKHVYLELYYAIAEEKYENRSELVSTYIISDYMPFSFSKMQYLLNASDKKYWFNSFIVARREWDKLFDSNYMTDLTIKKRGYNYRNYVLPHDEYAEEYYVERGYVANNSVFNNNKLNQYAFGPINIEHLKGSDWEKTIKRIVRYCKAHNVEISFFVAPEPEVTIVGKCNYQEYYSYVKDLADSLAVDYFDFNLCKDLFLDRNDESLFKDIDHLNSNGAEVFSSILSDICNGKIRKEDVLYVDYTEMINDRAPKVYGVAGSKSNTEEDQTECYIISNKESGIEYQVIARPNGKEMYEVKPSGEDRAFVLPAEETGKLIVTWYSVQYPNCDGNMVIEY